MTQDVAGTIARLERDVRRLRIALTGVALAGGAAVLTAAAAPAGDARFDRIDVHRLNLVEPDGTLRAVLTSDARTPGPIIDGREGTRNFPFSGLILYDHEGDEIGGYGSGRGASGEIMVSTMDFGQSEAIASFRRFDADGRGSVGIFLNDQPPAGMPSREAVQQDWSRIRLSNGAGRAELVMNDGARRPRIRLVVDERNEAAIELLAPSGEVVRRFDASAAE